MSKCQNSSIMLSPCTCVEKLNTRVVNHTCKKSSINLRVHPLTTTLLETATPEVFRLQPSECGSSVHQSAILAHEVLYLKFIQVHFGTLQVLKFLLHIFLVRVSLSHNTASGTIVQVLLTTALLRNCGT